MFITDPCLRNKQVLQVVQFYACFNNKSPFRGQEKTRSSKKEHVLLSQWQNKYKWSRWVFHCNLGNSLLTCSPWEGCLLKISPKAQSKLHSFLKHFGQGGGRGGGVNPLKGMGVLVRNFEKNPQRGTKTLFCVHCVIFCHP